MNSDSRQIKRPYNSRPSFRKPQSNRSPAWKKKPREVRLSPLEVEVRNGDINEALKVLKNKISKDGILTELKRKRFAEKPSEKRRRKHREALKKLRKSRGKKARQSGNTYYRKPNSSGNATRPKSEFKPMMSSNRTAISGKSVSSTTTVVDSKTIYKAKVGTHGSSS